MAEVVSIYLDGLVASSYRNQMTSGLKLITRTRTAGASEDIHAYPWHNFRPEDVLEFQQTMLARGSQPGSINVYITALRGLLREALNQGLVTKDHYEAVAAVPSLYEDRARRPGRFVDSAILAALFRVCARDRTLAGRRDEALLTLLYAAGLKLGDVLALEVAGFDASEGIVRTAANTRTYLSTSATQCLSDYLSSISATASGTTRRPSSKLLVSTDAHGKIDTEREISGPAVRFTLQRRCREAGVPSLAPADLRNAHLDELEEALRYAQRQLQVPYVDRLQLKKDEPGSQVRPLSHAPSPRSSVE